MKNVCGTGNPGPASGTQIFHLPFTVCYLNYCIWYGGFFSNFENVTLLKDTRFRVFNLTSHYVHSTAHHPCHQAVCVRYRQRNPAIGMETSRIVFSIQICTSSLLQVKKPTFNHFFFSAPFHYMVHVALLLTQFLLLR